MIVSVVPLAAAPLYPPRARIEPFHDATRFTSDIAQRRGEVKTCGGLPM